MIAPARLAALDVISSVIGGGVDLPDAIAGARTRLTDERDRALLVELTTGTIRWLAALDHVIAARSSRPLAKLDAVVLDILRLATYQLLHLTRVPASAVVDDAVSMVRAKSKTSAAGFVNAVLRGISRSGRDLGLPARPADGDDDREHALDYLATTLSHPRWLMARWLERFGLDDAARWAQFDNAPAPLTLLANRLVTTRDGLADRLAQEGVEVRPTRYAPDGLEVLSGHPLQGTVGGRFVAMDETSQLVGLLATGVPAGRVLDACAAPGGKTLVVAGALGPEGRIVAADVRAKRVRLLGQTVTAAGAQAVTVVQLDLRQPLPFTAAFDVVLVDAPCSGLGILRRDPEIRWRRREADLSAMADAQMGMLRHAASVVTPGGRLVYSTCSSEPDENEAVVEAFLAERPGFGRLPRPQVAALLPPAAEALLDPVGQLRTWPWRDGLEAFFGAVLVRLVGSP
jgi:16S rRNA (cytosine967-C5)-methyltransferase